MSGANYTELFLKISRNHSLTNISREEHLDILIKIMRSFQVIYHS
ncbi:25366_t:CDS:2 [Dentiscutata erythropus]|uniref:25366_t:CDS:1 n=1 Tax=Dentiscutata erythropus TaxID=1348616 RepID=A0A9N9G9I0_9GLOM|nr:25366_t:CDS:2 [Dentiscutata erythropus]